MPLRFVSFLALVCHCSAFISPTSRTRVRSIASKPIGSLQTLADQVASDVTTSTEKDRSGIRPFHQQWWPVAAVSSLQKDRPNELQILGKSLVTFWDGHHWQILDDACSHRFAPLSEGRVDNCRLQCAYHGWEFNSQGECTRVPQEPSQVDKARPVQRYPVREAISMLWVWMDQDSYDNLGSSIPLPVNPYLRETVDQMGPNTCFQRDLPYGMEILGENLLDLSHLPFAHHSVATLNRDLGGPLPTRMLSQEERIAQSQWEYDYAEQQHSPVMPVFQAEIVDPAQHDPTLKGLAQQAPDANATKSWLTTIGYYEPCHVRYRRDRGESGGSHVELFFCPTSEGKSRVFLFNTFRRPPPASAPDSTAGKLVHWLKPSTWKQKAFAIMLKKILNSERGHIISHSIFDGDGIFLHKQGNRMKNSKLTFRDYSTPSSADVLLNAYRRVLDQAADKTRSVPHLEAMADSVVGNSAYGDDAARSLLLDRYNTHTKNCPLCLSALQKSRRQKNNLQVFQTALQGAVGASSVALVVLLSLWRQVAPAVIKPALRAVLLTLVGSLAASWLARRSQQKLETKINSFLFEDYVHADKN